MRSWAVAVVALAAVTRIHPASAEMLEGPCGACRARTAKRLLAMGSGAIDCQAGTATPAQEEVQKAFARCEEHHACPPLDGLATDTITQALYYFFRGLEPRVCSGPSGSSSNAGTP